MGSPRLSRNRSIGSYLNYLDEKSKYSEYRTDYSSNIATNAVTEASLAEELEIIQKSIQSGNYIPGEAGWKITGEGDAEFGSVFVRGDITAYSGAIGYWNISSPAVTRVIGPYTLLGTFLESAGIGDNDDSTTSGSYVGLFKSYFPDPVDVSRKSRLSNIATITILDHDFIVGDYVTVDLEDDTSFNSNGKPVQIVEADYTTISYVNVGSDVTDSESLGYVSLYNEDIAGLYLRDYSKASFDYGFFSNKGIAYTSAEILNLIHNPSFEYKVSGSNTYSSSGWSATSGLTQITFSSGYPTARYASQFGVSIAWTSSSRTDYLTATVDYDAGDDYNIFDSSTSLYLGLDLFPAPLLTPVAVSSMSTSGTTSMTVTTSTSHGVVTGDYVYLNFSAVDVDGNNYAYDTTYEDYGPKVFEVTNTSGPTVFFIKNPQGTTGTLTLSASPTIYPKVVSPAFKLSEIKLKFGSDVSTTLQDVLDEVYKTTDWVPSSSKELSISATEAIEDVINNVAIPPMKNGKNLSYVPLDPQKIEDYYLSLDPTGHSNGDPFYILFPTWTYKKDLDGATTVTKLLNTSYIIDNVYLSKSSKFFYADSSTTSNSWYESGSGTSAPTQASVEAPRSWIDIDLENQKAVLNYIDYIGLESSTYSQPLTTKPSISMAPSATSFSYIDYLNSYNSPNSYNPTVDSNTLNLTAGTSRYLLGSTPLTVERDSYINISVDRARSGVEMVANYDVFGFASKTASVSASIDKNSRSLVSILADFIVADTAKFVTSLGKPSLNASYVINNTNDSTSGGANHIAYEVETTTITGITDTTFVSGSPECAAFFTTGPSGVVEIHVYADYQNTAVTSGTGLSYVSFRITNLADTITIFDSSLNRSVIRSGTLRESGTVFYVWDGSPNTRYKIKTMHRTTTNATLSIFRRSIMVIPIT